MSLSKHKILTLLVVVVLFCDALHGKYITDYGKTSDHLRGKGLPNQAKVSLVEDSKINVEGEDSVNTIPEEEGHPSQGFLKDAILIIAKELNIDVEDLSVSPNPEDDDNATMSTPKVHATTRDSVDIWCDTACKDGSAGAECECPDNPIG